MSFDLGPRGAGITIPTLFMKLNWKVGEQDRLKMQQTRKQPLISCIRT